MVIPFHKIHRSRRIPFLPFVFREKPRHEFFRFLAPLPTQHQDPAHLLQGDGHTFLEQRLPVMGGKNDPSRQDSHHRTEEKKSSHFLPFPGDQAQGHDKNGGNENTIAPKQHEPQ